MVQAINFDLVPEGWKHGWMSAKNPDENAELSRGWSANGWGAFREEHYLGIVPNVFGYLSDTDKSAPWTPYAPWGMSVIWQEPKLHPDDD